MSEKKNKVCSKLCPNSQAKRQIRCTNPSDYNRDTFATWKRLLREKNICQLILGILYNIGCSIKKFTRVVAYALSSGIAETELR